MALDAICKKLKSNYVKQQLCAPCDKKESYTSCLLIKTFVKLVPKVIKFANGLQNKIL